MKKIIIIACSLLITITAAAQTKHELSINAFGGLQTLNYKLSNNGSTSMGFGFGGGLGYAFLFNPTWSVATGVDFSLYNGSLDYSTYAGSYKINSNYFNFTINGYTESQSALLLEVPILIRYSVNALRFSAGLKLGFPMSTKYTASAAGHTTDKVHLDHENQDYYFTGAQKVEEQSGNFEASTAVQLYLEAAYRMALSEKMGLSFGLYFSYGLNDIHSKSNGTLVTYSTNQTDLNTTAPKYTYGSSMMDTDNVSSLRPLAIGLKIRFDLGF